MTMSRRLLLSTATLSALAVATGCQNSANSTTAPAAGASASPIGDPAAHHVTDYRGKTIGVDRPPTRVIATYDGLCVDNIVACGLTPLSSAVNLAKPDRPRPWLDGKLDGAEYLAADDGLQFEKMAALAPELIISSYYDEKTYAKLEQIAPLYMINHDTGWPEQLAAVGKLLWRDREAAAAAAAVDAAIAGHKADLTARAGEKVAVICTFGGDASKVYLSDRIDGIGMALESLGFANLPEPKEKGMPFIELSVEKLDTVTGDRLVVIDFDYESAGPSPTTTKLLASAVGKTIPAAQGGVVWMSKAATNASYLDTALSQPFLLNELATKLA